MENFFEELGIPKKYLKKTTRDNRYIALVNKLWLKSLVKHSKVTEFIEKNKPEVWPDSEEHKSWIKIFISIYQKRNSKVIPLPRIRSQNLNSEPPLLFPQLMQYICQTNYKNLWKEAFKNYNCNESLKETQVNLVDYNEVLREILVRIYGCSIINTYNPQETIQNSTEFHCHLNILPAVCAVETLNAIFVIHLPFLEHNLSDCLTFSPAILEKCYSKPLFIIYQLLNVLKSLHDRSLTLGDISLTDIYLTEDMWIYVFPQIMSNIYIQEPQKEFIKSDCRKGHKFSSIDLKCLNCGIRTYDKVQTSNESLEKLCQLWIEGSISNFTYLTALNKFSGRKLNDPNCHYVFPWVTDFSSRCGKNWRDLKKSKFRLNKGDRQLDITYDHSQTQVPHHVSDVLSSITYYVYTARRTSRNVLCKNVRTNWVPGEYPNSIQRLYEWTPDESIPEFYSDPSVFRSIHDDLDDLEVPAWSSSPEDFIEKHREALESQHVSERLHHWIDLTFGYKLSGNAAVESKNVCLSLADEHSYLTKSGVIQLFTHPHPPRNTPSMFWGKSPPKAVMKTTTKKSRDRSSSSTKLDTMKSDEEEATIETETTNRGLGLSRILSRSRSSLQDEQHPNRSPSSQRSASVGPKNPSFTSHVSQKPKPSNSNTGIIPLPKDYKPELALELLEKRHKFMSKTFHSQTQSKYKEASDEFVTSIEDCIVQNAFTNFIFSESFEQRFRKSRAVKSHTFPLDAQSSFTNFERKENQVICNYSDIISRRRIRELQILGCLIVEIFMFKQLRAMGFNSQSFNKRLKGNLIILKSCKVQSCVRTAAELLLQPEIYDLSNFKYPAVTDLGLPPPSAHLFLEPLLHCLFPFNKMFGKVYEMLSNLKEFKNVVIELNVLYHFDCDGSRCAEYENLEKTKILFAQNIGECKVKACAKSLETLFQNINTTTDSEIIKIILPHIRELIEDPPTSVLAAWYLFELISKVLGPSQSIEQFLNILLKLYEMEPNVPYNGKIAKLYHHSFLLRLIVRLGLKCFLENFVTPLVEAVGGYKDCENDITLHTHSEVAKKFSHLKTMDSEHIEMSTSDDSSHSEEKLIRKKVNRTEEMFEFDEESNEEQMKSLIEHLELNVASDLPFNHSVAEEALDATVNENLDQLRNLEELMQEDLSHGSGVTSPTIPIPSSYRQELSNISCDVGSSRKGDSELDFALESPSSDVAKKSKKQENAKISEMSADSLVWLSHRLGPVLTAKYLSRNLLKMLTLCYVGKENLVEIETSCLDISISSSRVVGDRNSAKVLECLSSIAGLYGEQLILFQYIPHMSELIALCKKKLTANLEGGLISCLALLKHIIPYLSDSTLMDQLQDVILKNIIHPTVRLLGSTKHTFPNGQVARSILARKYIDTLYILSVRVGADMTKSYLAVPALQRFFLIFNKTVSSAEESNTEEDNEKIVLKTSESHFVEVKRDGTTSEWAIGGKPVQISHVKNFENQSISQSKDIDCSDLALEELKAVFTPELAHVSYEAFMKHVGSTCLEISLKNHDVIKSLYQKFEERNLELQIPKVKVIDSVISSSGSIGSNIALIGNRIDIQSDTSLDSFNELLGLVSNRMENNSRHLRGNWLAYWEHEIGRSDKDVMFNFKQIKLQTFTGHTNSIKALYVLDNENSFMSGSRDKTIKLWSLRSQGDGSSTSNCQMTYTSHKKSVLAISFVESMRLVASCDSIVHIWDPFMGITLAHLDSPKFAPVNVLKSMPAPSSQIFAATTEGTLKIIDTRICSYIYELKVFANPNGLIRCLAVAPSGLWIAAGQSSGGITVLDTRTGLVLSTWKAHESEVLQIVAHNDDTIISSSLDQNISVWNLDGKFKFHMKGSTEPVRCLSIYNNELISGTTANRIGVHTSIEKDASFSTTKLRSDTFRGLLTSMAVLPLNRLLLLGADSGNISLLC